MVSPEPRIVFMGTPDFAVASLQALLAAGRNVAGVVTAPDKPSGRGLKLTPSPVKRFALEHGLPVLQPKNLKSPEFNAELSALQPDLQVVVAFRMLPEAVWKLPPMGTFNLHASLLPQYRGAAPINWAIIHGDNVTGVTTFFLQQEVDTGSVLFRKQVDIGPDETAGELHDRLMTVGAELVVKTVDAITEGSIRPVPQEELTDPSTVLRPAPKLNRDNIRIEWNRRSVEVHNLIRGLSPYPAAYTFLSDGTEKEPVQCKIYRVKPSIGECEGRVPGAVFTDQKSTLRVFTADGFVEILEIQPAGKQRMSIRDFLNGFRFTPSHRFE